MHTRSRSISRGEGLAWLWKTCASCAQKLSQTCGPRWGALCKQALPACAAITDAGAGASDDQNGDTAITLCTIRAQLLSIATSGTGSQHYPDFRNKPWQAVTLSLSSLVTAAGLPELGQRVGLWSPPPPTLCGNKNDPEAEAPLPAGACQVTMAVNATLSAGEFKLEFKFKRLYLYTVDSSFHVQWCIRQV